MLARFDAVFLAEDLDLDLVAIGEALCLRLKEGVVPIKVWLVVPGLSAFDEAREGRGCGVGDLGVRVEHLDDAVDEHEDGVAELPVLLVEELEAHLAAREDVEVLEAVHHPHLRRLVGVRLSCPHAQLVVAALQAREVLPLEDHRPLAQVLRPVAAPQQNRPDRRLHLLLVLVLHRLQRLLVFVAQPLQPQLTRHQYLYRSNRRVSPIQPPLPLPCLQFYQMKVSAKEGSKQALPLHLPHIRPARSLPAIRPLREFDLRCVNLRMKPYEPSSDKFLSQFFERQTRIRALSTEPHQKSLKTEPASLERGERGERGGAGQAVKGKQRRQKTLLTEQSRTQAVKELSRQDFNSFLQTMRQRVGSRNPK